VDFKAFETEGWGERAPTYDRLIGAVTARFADPLLDAAHVTAGARVLDAACGTGVLTAAAAARGAEPVGIDLTAQMVATARRRHPGLRFTEGDAERLGFPARAFDGVVAGFLLHHLPQPETAAGEFARVLAPGGRLAATVWDDPSRMRLIGLVDDALAEAGADPSLGLPEGPPAFAFARPADFAALLERAGFTGVEVRTVAFDHRVAGGEELWEGLLGGTVRTTRQVRAQPPAVRERVREALIRLAEAYRTADGLAIPVSAMLASGSSRARP
jgi:SAM-dependent methyltransferase